MKKQFTIALIYFLFTAIGAFAQTSDLIISEYGEGSSGNSKYVEIYNGTGATVDLSDYQLWRISNGGTWPESTYDFQSDSLMHDATLVVANNSGDVPGADEYDGFCSWNGDDAIGLAKDIGGTITLIDAVGEEGGDPGAGWDVAGVSDGTVNHRLVRKDTVCDTTTDWALSAGTTAANSQWVVTAYSTGAAQAGHSSDCGIATCPLVVVPGLAVCDDTTNGSDTYSVELIFNGGGQGGGTYIITPTNSGDDPNTDTTGVMVFQGVEGSDITIYIDSDDCDLEYTIAAPECIPLPQLVLNEYQNDPHSSDGDANGDGTANTSQDEFIEFYNDGDSSLDLSGWEIHDRSGLRHSFPVASILDPDSFAVIFGGGTPTGIPGQLVQTASVGFLGLGNSGDDILLYDDMGMLILEYTYSGSSPGNDVAVGRNPDIAGSFVDHDDIPIPGRLFSPGEANVSLPSGCSFYTLVGDPECLSQTSGMDSFSVEVTFGGGGQGMGTYTITPAFEGDHPDTVATGTMVFYGTEPTDLTINISSSSCTVDTTVAAPACEPGPEIVLNEYHKEPDGVNGDANGDGTASTTEDEFIEFYNDGETSIDLSGWEIHDGFGERHTFPMGSVLDTGQIAVVFGGGVPTGVPGQIVQTASSGSLGLNNGGDDILLYDDMGALVIDFTYGSSPGDNVAVGRNPDITGAFEDHDGIPYVGRLFSPGEFNVQSVPACTLELTAGDATCSDTTTGMDTFTVVVAFTGGGQGNGTYTITPAFTGDHPDTATSGNLTFFGIEPADITITVTSDSCNLTEVVAAPSCVPPPPCAQVGDLIVTEFMANPVGINDGNAEYIEIFNRSDDTIDIYQYELSDLSINSHVIQSSLIIPPNDLVVLGSGSPVPNIDYIYQDFNMANAGDEIHLRCTDETGTYLIAGVNYSDGDPFGAGVSMELHCIDLPGPLYDDDDFIAGTDTFYYTGIPLENFGSPGELGNTDTVEVIPTQLIATSYQTIAGESQEFTITLCITDADSLTPCGLEDYIVLEQVSGLTALISDDSLAIDNGCATFTCYVPSIDSCSTVSFNAHSSSFTLNETIDMTIQETIHHEGFLCAGLTWSIENVDGQSSWECDTSGGYMSVNGYNDANPSDDWLISPAFDLTTYDDIFISFMTRERFSGEAIEFKVSGDYSGTGDPNSATWTTLPFDLDTTSNGFDFNPWTFSGFIDLNGHVNSSTYFAFHYKGVNNDAAEWLVDNVTLIGCAKPCLITAVTVDNIGACDPMSGTFTADIEVVYQDAPGSGYLVLSGDATDSVEVTSMAFVADSGSYSFDGIEFDADGGLKSVTAYFTSDTTCVYEAVDLPGTDVQPCDGGATVFGGLVINEVWNDVTYSGSTCFSNKAFIELLVVASIDEDTTTQFVNLQNWIIDPSNDVNDAGHIRIKSGCLTEVPVGSIIVIYNADNIPAGISGPDEMDADSNLVYFIPSNSGCLEYTTDASYPGTTYTDGDDGTCTHAQIISAFASSIPYTVETRHPHSFLRAYTNVYDDLNYNPSMPFTPQGASAFDCGNIDDVSAVIHDAPPTPGLSNTVDNGIIIDKITEEAHVPDPDAINYNLFLPGGANPTCSELYARPCRDTVFITGPLTVTDTIRAGLYIISSGDVTTTGSTVFDSPEILLEAGFEVPLGMEFTTLYVGCTPSALRHVRDPKNDSGKSEIFIPDESKKQNKRQGNIPR